MRCTICSSEYLSPQPTDDWLAQEYADYYKKRGSSIERPKAAFFEELLESLDLDFSNQRVLDVGAAEGDLIFGVTKRWASVEAHALEGNPESRPFFEGLACTYTNADIVEWLAAGHEERFDTIFLFDVLEHVRDPILVIHDLSHNHLRSAGTIIATFPCVHSLSRKTLGRFWPQYKVEHLSYFSTHAISRMEVGAGLRRVVVRPLCKKLPIGYFLSVGCSFGPAGTNRLARIAKAILPPVLSRIRVPFMLGEVLWIASR